MQPNPGIPNRPQMKGIAGRLDVWSGYAWAVSGVVQRTLATRGRKRAGPTPQVWEGWSEAEGPKDNTAYCSPIQAYPIDHK